MNNDDRKIIDDNSALIRFLESAMTKANTFVMHFDTQANILIGINLGILGVSLSLASKFNFPIPLYILAIFSMLSLITALYSIHPPKFMRKQGQKESLFYNKRVNSYDSGEEYSKAVCDLLNDKARLIENYTLEIYNTYKYAYRPKRNLFKLARNLLIAGILLTLASSYFMSFLVTVG